MIERFYLKDYLSFSEVELELNHGLVVFTGPSGSGKSILMQAILASLGFADAQAGVSESSVNWVLDEESHGILNESTNVFRQVKKEKTRYFVNNQSISKRTLGIISRDHMRHLSLKEYSDFSHASLLGILDRFAAEKSAAHAAQLDAYAQIYRDYRNAGKQLAALEADEKQVVELCEFARFEIAKIDAAAPQPGEDEALLHVKKLLSKRERIEEKVALAQAIFDHECVVADALGALEIDSGFFDDAMNTLRSHFESAQLQFEELEEMDIESVLDRIEQLSELKRRYGSIEDTLRYRDEKASELARYENISFEKEALQKAYSALSKQMQTQSAAIHEARKAALPAFEAEFNAYLNQLYLQDATLQLQPCEADEFGCDTVEVILNNTSLQKVSTGEFNRLRLALLAVHAKRFAHAGGVLMLDEIDANLSGEESMSVARVLKQLSKKYQIFAISHQPQLTSMGDQHFLIYKESERSFARKLDHNERIREIARIISADNITDEALGYASKLLQSSLDTCA